jgi:hypothetical protein
VTGEWCGGEAAEQREEEEEEGAGAGAGVARERLL